MASILILLIFYMMFLSVFWVLNRKRPGIASYQNPAGSDLNALTAAHAMGIFFMLLPSWIFASVPFFLLRFSGSAEQIIALLICLALIVVLPWKKWSGAEPIHENPSPPVSQIILYAVARFVFLIAYEWFFRGLLLYAMIPVVGSFNAVIINILLYMLAHFHKGRKEIIGCIPFGLLLCLFTIRCQSVWPAVIIHLTLAIRNEGPPLYRFFALHKKPAL